MASITELIKNIRSAVFGKDVRESIASAIEQTYKDAAEKRKCKYGSFRSKRNFCNIERKTK